jgi:hypothetical protein
MFLPLRWHVFGVMIHCFQIIKQASLTRAGRYVPRILRNWKTKKQTISSSRQQHTVMIRGKRILSSNVLSSSSRRQRQRRRAQNNVDNDRNSMDVMAWKI